MITRCEAVSIFLIWTDDPRRESGYYSSSWIDDNRVLIIVYDTKIRKTIFNLEFLDL